MPETRRRGKRLLDEEMEEYDEEEVFWKSVVTTGLSAVLNVTRSRRAKPKWGSRPGKRANIDRERAAGHDRIWKDYFAEQPVYPNRIFRTRFRMRRKLFWRIHDAVCKHDAYFIQKRDAAGVLGLSSIQKIIAALRMLALGISGDAIDEYCRLSKTSAYKSLMRFVRAICQVFEEEYLQQPKKEDMEAQMDINKARGFPGMFGSLDYMHVEWKNCPVAWQGQFTNKDGNKSLILEAVCDQSLQIWHACFGLPGGNNDLNVLDRSPLVNNFMESKADQVGFTINGKSYKGYYLLADSIYPEWSLFVSTILHPQSDETKLFARLQEGARKDIERCFGVIQSRFHILVVPIKQLSIVDIIDIVMACVILHNMILDDEIGLDLEPWEEMPVMRANKRPPMDWKAYKEATKEIENVEAHFTLRNDLITHIWARRRNLIL